MLNQKKSARWARLKLLMVLPITAGILCISTMAFTKDYGFVELGSSLNKPSIQLDTVKKPFDTKDGIHVPNPNALYLALRTDPKTKKISTYTKKLILLNGKELKAGTSGGVKNIKYMITLDETTAKAKYGKKGSYGAIEIFSSNPEIIGTPPKVKLPANSSQKIIILSPPPTIEPAQKVKKKQVSTKTDQISNLPQTYFYARNVYNEGKVIKADPRFIVLNGQGVEDNKLFVGVQNTESVRLLSQLDAVKKYGDKAKNGVIEITGNNIKMDDKFPTPLPFPKLTLDRAKSEMLVIPDSDYEIKTLTIYKNGKVVYNTTDYKNDWNGKRGNYGKFVSDLPTGSYQYFMKIAGEPLKNKRGVIDIKD